MILIEPERFLKRTLRVACLVVMFLSCTANNLQAQDFDTEVGLVVPQDFVEYHGYNSVEEFKSGTNALIRAGKFSLHSPKSDEAFRNANEFKQAISVLLKNSFAMDFLQLTEEQRKNLLAEHANYVRRNKEIRERIRDSDHTAVAELTRLQPEFRAKVEAILLPFQLAELAGYGRIRDGIPKLLLTTPIGEHLELTESQRAKIKAKSQALADKISNFEKEIKAEAANVANSVLTVEQKQKLEVVLPSLDKSGRATVEEIKRQHSFKGS